MARLRIVLHAHVALPVPPPTVWNILSKRDASFSRVASKLLSAGGGWKLALIGREAEFK